MHTCYDVWVHVKRIPLNEVHWWSCVPPSMTCPTLQWMHLSPLGHFVIPASCGLTPTNKQKKRQEPRRLNSRNSVLGSVLKDLEFHVLIYAITV